MNIFKKEEKGAYTFDGMESPVEVRYRVADAAEAEIVIMDQLKDTEIFKKFVLEAKCKDIDEWVEGVDADQVIKTPGTFGLIHLVAVDIVNRMRMGVQRKNLQ